MATPSMPRPDDSSLADRILRLAAAGAFVAGEGPLDVVEASLLGRGESYAAWLLRRRDAAPLVLRVARRPLAEMPRPLAQEYAALRLVPDGVGTRGLAMSDDPANPLGHPWVLSTYVPGEVRAVDAWTAQDISNHVETMARLHTARASDRRGPVGGATETSLDLLAELDGGWGWWNENHPEVTAAQGVAELHAAVRAFVAERADAFAGLDSFALIHGDLVATNIVFDGGTPRYIDWEWSELGDVAQDLAYLGGTVHGGPWYVPMDDATVAGTVETYAATVAALGGHADVEGLRRRRDSWEVQERFLSSLHFARQAAAGVDDMYAPAVADLRTRLAGRPHDLVELSSSAGGTRWASWTGCPSGSSTKATRRRPSR